MSITTVAMSVTTVTMGITIVVTDIDNSYVATGIDDVIMSIATILLFNCARGPKS
jgi:hypothetical protein